MTQPEEMTQTEPTNVTNGTDNGSEEAGGETTLEDLHNQIEEARQLAEERWELYLRARADLENERKRFARELETTRKYAITDLLEALLPVKDTLELGLAAAEGSDVAAMSEGVRLTLKTFDSVLSSYGVEEVTAEGAQFDPELHEAIAVEPSEDHPADTVLAVHQKGYLLNGRLVRPARVTVSQGA